jgi:hypothetical protein
MFGCIAVHKSAEPNSLMLRMDVGQRDALIEEEPGTYYVTQHYEPYPCVLVRLSRVSPDALRDLVHAAYRFIEPSAKKPSGSVRRRVSRARKGPRVK